MATTELNKSNFEAEVANSDMAVIDFWAEWCGPCKSFAPTFEAVSELFPNVLFGKVNSEIEQDLAVHFNIRSIPTLIIIRENVMLFSEAGALSKEDLTNVITQAASADMKEIHADIAKYKQEHGET